MPSPFPSLVSLVSLARRHSLPAKMLAALTGCLCVMTSPVAAGQVRESVGADDIPPVVVDEQVGRAPEVGGNMLGQRQTRADVARKTGIEPMARIDNRIANRVQSRLRNRIDRNYDPQANATSPFIIAQERTQTTRPR